ncbi:MAG TPA: hypothetical protein VMC03_17840 [Streptosporangiaceae bacterium]|nr:hypothetical protein [Streptosporangiaceae bacterium]
MSSSARPGRARERRGASWTRIPSGFCAAVAVIAVAACGSTASSASSASSRPAYCSDRTDLQKSVKGLTSLNASAGISGLQAQADKVKASATKLANATKSDFPGQSNALNSSITALDNSVATLASNPSAANITVVTKDAGNVVTAARNLLNATNAKCG